MNDLKTTTVFSLAKGPSLPPMMRRLGSQRGITSGTDEESDAVRKLKSSKLNISRK